MNLQRQSYFSVSSEGVPIRNIADYSPFGVQLDGRTISGDSYRNGFQNQEKDDELKGAGNSVNYKYRMHDPRVGRFFAVDPLSNEYPWNSSYAFSENKVIAWVELEGLESFYSCDGKYLGTIGNSTEIRIINNMDLWNKNFSKTKSKKSTEAERALNILNKNSVHAFKSDELYKNIKKWGDEFTPKSKNHEFATRIFSKDLINEDGNKFKVFTLGFTVTTNEKSNIDPDNSVLYTAEMEELFCFEIYATIHTHPSGDISRQEFSPNDLGYSIIKKSISYMFQYDSKSLFKFYPKTYINNAAFEITPQVDYRKSDFETDAVNEATKEVENVLK